MSFDLTGYNTLHVPAKAKNFLEINTQSDLDRINSAEPFLFLGLGANILFTKDFPGTVYKVNLLGKSVIKETTDFVDLEVAAGENWHDLVAWSVNQNLSGLENMALIPGTVGAAVVGNIAAYGGNQEDVFQYADVYELSTGKTHRLSKSDCQFGYRESVFGSKSDFLITTVCYRLSKVPKLETSYHATRHASLLPTLAQFASEPYTVKDVYNAIVKIRTEKVPDMTKVGTAGSFFKNPLITKDKFDQLKNLIPDLLAYPAKKLTYQDTSNDDLVKLSIGRVFDELGWRGKTIGRVSTHNLHALYVINLGGATGQEIFEYAELMRADVKKTLT